MVGQCNSLFLYLAAKVAFINLPDIEIISTDDVDDKVYKA